MPTTADEGMEVESVTHAGHADHLGTSCSPPDNLAESVSLEQESPAKTGENKKEEASREVVGESSRESSPLAVVTETMVAEEERLREERGDSSERQQVTTNANNSS